MFVPQDFLFGPNVPMVNENAITNLLVDVDFLEGEFKTLGKAQLSSSFTELRLVCPTSPFFRSMLR